MRKELCQYGNEELYMVTTHVFIVNEKTFPIHLKYLFAGTGFSEKQIENIKASYKNVDINEKKNFYGLLADITRIRNNDLIIFYLEKIGFFGVFQAVGEAFMENTDLNEKTYLERDLGMMKLFFRVKIKPYNVFPKAISEWEALDKFPEDDFQKAQWSLIYRKLRGNRGCTPITELESKILIEKISYFNNRIVIQPKDGFSFTYNKERQQIELTPHKFDYQGQIYNLDNVLQKMTLDDKKGKSIKEERLQVYFTQNIGKEKLEPICGKRDEIIWIGNEVACGVGMQRIDLMTVTKQNEKTRNFNLIELKINVANPDIIPQLERYLNWTTHYIKDATKENIQLVIVTRKVKKAYHRKTGKPLKEMQIRNETSDKLIAFNKKEQTKDIKWFEFYFEDDEIKFEQVLYKKLIE